MLKMEGHKDKEIKRLKGLLADRTRQHQVELADLGKLVDEARAEWRKALRSGLFNFVVFVPAAFVAGVIAAAQVLPLL